MRKIINNITAIIIAALMLQCAVAAADETSKAPLKVDASLLLVNNQAPFVSVTLKTKIDRKFTPVADMEVQFYLDKDAASGGQLIGKAKTNNRGKLTIGIPASLQAAWKAAPTHKIIAVTAKTDKFDETSTEVNCVKTRVTLDTAEDKNVKMKLEEWKDDHWAPVKDAEVKIGVKRLLSDLNISEKETYKTDSAGEVVAEFKKTGLPGDKNGNIILVAKMDDNDTYGSLRFEKPIPWGEKYVPESGALGRALWAGRFHSPWWLLFIAYFIIIGVWGSLAFLVMAIFKIRAIGLKEKAAGK